MTADHEVTVATNKQHGNISVVGARHDGEAFITQVCHLLSLAACVTNKVEGKHRDVNWRNGRNRADSRQGIKRQVTGDFNPFHSCKSSTCGTLRDGIGRPRRKAESHIASIPLGMTE